MFVSDRHATAVAGALALFAGLARSEPARAQVVNVPLATWTFEDVEGTASDADGNDLGIQYTKQCRFDMGGNLVGETVDFTPLVAGAAKNNTLSIALPGPTSRVTLARGTAPAETLPPEPDGDFVLYASFKSAFTGNPSGMVNTTGGPVVGAPANRLDVTYSPAIPMAPSIECAVPDFVLERPSEGVRIDRDTRLPNNQPLGANLPAGFRFAKEGVALPDAYPDFLTWVAEAIAGCPPEGCAHAAWTSNPDEADVLPALPEGSFPVLDPPSCLDGARNRDETGIDCGGSYCDPCISALVAVDCSGDPPPAGLSVTAFLGTLGYLDVSPDLCTTVPWELGDEVSGWIAYDADAPDVADSEATPDWEYAYYTWGAVLPKWRAAIRIGDDCYESSETLDPYADVGYPPDGLVQADRYLFDPGYGPDPFGYYAVAQGLSGMLATQPIHQFNSRFEVSAEGAGWSGPDLPLAPPILGDCSTDESSDAYCGWYVDFQDPWDENAGCYQQSIFAGGSLIALESLP